MGGCPPCPVCVENIPRDKFMGLSCGHLFCPSCWDMHFRFQIEQGVTMGESFPHCFFLCLYLWCVVGQDGGCGIQSGVCEPQESFGFVWSVELSVLGLCLC